jgi:hypothetical protein
MRGFFAALRMTNKNRQRQERATAENRQRQEQTTARTKANAGILRCAQNDKQEQATARTGNGKGEMRGFFAALRMTNKNRQRQKQIPPLRSE